MLKLLCKVGLHHGTWVYVTDRRPSCAQTRTCQRCSSQSDRYRHDMWWEPDGMFSSTETGTCQRCNQYQHRKKRLVGPGPD